MRVLAGSLLAPCWMLLYSVAAMLAITGPCYTVMFQLSPTYFHVSFMAFDCLSKLLHSSSSHRLQAIPPGYAFWLHFLWLHSFGCIAASLRRCIAAPPAIFCPCLL
ncbi:hypothetical protein V8C86DRAFT_2932716, partial [Haematococcus lacustris]